MMQQQPKREPIKDVSIRPLEESDLPAAELIMRLAFGTFLGVPDPMEFMGDANFIGTRWSADPTAAFGAAINGELVGSNLAAKWGSLGLFGPLTVHPDYWDGGVGTRLVEPVMELFAEWGIKHAGLLTSGHSLKHVGLYQKFGFWPGSLIAVMGKPVRPPENAPQWSKYSEASEGEQESHVAACRELTDGIYEGLDVEREIRAAQAQGLGDTVLLWDDAGLAGLAVCHYGPGTEAGSGMFYVKFGAARAGKDAGERFEQLLDTCESLAAEREIPLIVAGVNAARHDAYRRMLARGFRSNMQGLAMHKPSDPGYNRSDVYVIDDWR